MFSMYTFTMKNLGKESLLTNKICCDLKPDYVITAIENANIRWDGLCNVSIDDYL